MKPKHFESIDAVWDFFKTGSHDPQTFTYVSCVDGKTRIGKYDGTCLTLGDDLT
jgi:hypothetical protein